MIELPDNIRKEIEAEVFKQHHTTDFYIIDTVWDVIASHLVERYPATMAWRIDWNKLMNGMAEAVENADMDDGGAR